MPPDDGEQEAIFDPCNKYSTGRLNRMDLMESDEGHRSK